ncbi:hypothetical protein F4820DRAFT_417723 [Hypoxylon rubiginosum]|uniref:Uncharacterized protein n=1 Tax=Hypoxylon rubiginosum TaxID=110542 RepID=A0ACB9Z3I9_9PEZI|nr:hypothetical protein F4820DRAFT_417723 [Hypoxylon rubiginosum]
MLSCGELVADSPAARAETPGSCATDAAAEEVELGRDIGSRVTGKDGTATVPSSMTDRIDGSAGDAVGVGIGEPIGGRLPSACNNATVGDAVVSE